MHRKEKCCLVVVVHIFYPSNWEAEADRSAWSINYKSGMMAYLLVPALRRHRQADLSDLQASLVYVVSSRTAWGTQKNPVFVVSAF